MKKFLLFSLALLLAQLTYAQRNCGAMDHLNMLIEQDPGLEDRMQEIERQTAHFINNQSLERVNGVITIPVVYHVVYNKRSTAQNLSIARLQSQLDVLNEDFRRTNNDADNVWSQAADTEIEFCLATVDPSGSTTNGITRTSSNKRSFGTNNAVKSSSSGGQDAWPASDYLNIWVCNIGGGILGYAQFPGGPASTDGVVLDYRYTGRGLGAGAPYDLGRTGTHEVGHWLNLRHIWGDTGCGGDDFVLDTPLAGSPNYTGSPCNFPGPNSCNTGAGDEPDMFQNYMDYSDDACMNLYTSDQTARMRAIFEPGGPRASLLNSTACGTPNGGGETCTDGILNNGETEVDCGGANCDPCSAGGTCEAPSGLRVSSFKRKNTSLAWNASSGATSYTVNYTGGSKTVSSTSTNIRTNNGQSYNWSVTANCSGGDTAESTSCSFVGNSSGSSSCSGAKVTDQSESVDVFPNPAKDELNIDISNIEGENIEFRIYNAAGMMVKSFRLGESDMNTISVANFQNGLYFLNAQTANNGTIAKRFMVVK